MTPGSRGGPSVTPGPPCSIEQTTLHWILFSIILTLKSSGSGDSKSNSPDSNDLVNGEVDTDSGHDKKPGISVYIYRNLWFFRKKKPLRYKIKDP